MSQPIQDPDQASATRGPTAPHLDRGVRLMMAWKRGDERAFEELVERYAGQVWSLLTRFLGPIPGREDLVQEVFLRVVRARDRYEPSAKLSTWLYRIVFNLSVNQTQRDGRRPMRLVGQEGEELLDQIVDEGAQNPERELMRADTVEAVRASIARLPERQRMALILAKYEGQSFLEIGEVLGISEKAVKSTVHRARENLREWLAPFVEAEIQQ